VSDKKFSPATQPILTEHAAAIRQSGKQTVESVAAPTDLTDERLETIAKNIESLTATTTLQVAAQIAEAHKIFRYRRDEGGFGGWVETRLGYSRQTAYNLLNVHEQFGGQESVQNLDTLLTASVLYLLAAPSTPKEARDAVVESAQAGKSVLIGEAKQIVEQAKGSKPPSKPSSKPRTESAKRKRRSSREVRLEAFFESILFVTTACTASVEMEIPDLNEKQRNKAIAQLKEASTALSTFGKRFKNINEKSPRRRRPHQHERNRALASPRRGTASRKPPSRDQSHRVRKRDRGFEGRHQIRAKEQVGVPVLDLPREQISRSATRFHL
jgi:hypothetical protein